MPIFPLFLVRLSIFLAYFYLHSSGALLTYICVLPWVCVCVQYLSERLLNKTAAPTLSTPMGSTLASEKESGLEAFLSKIGGDGRAIDHTELNIELHTSSPILLEKEKIIMAFKAGRYVYMYLCICAHLIVCTEPSHRASFPILS